ncbi:hepatocyte growth factor-regulated tyrosine kinase substrate isoform X2 [Eupeodes corollae]|uniref:hepatocyte growth factor-regulated tyrosine kinase substrate isoform X2 n=1 Tax=Eupeodes corollae TaxID=290404 RepID=UPI0024905E57|nr:hepatocyte growth factor-regulated tyrosine kinase substrate isoform X2 [Eupeodes corollae]
MFRSSTFEKTLENATSHLRLEPDWPSILLICDTIRQNDVTPKQAFLAIKKKMSSPNPHSACYALLVLESVVKNCGQPIHEEVFTKENCEMFSTFLEQTPHENVRQKMLELVQTWAYAFRTSEKYQSIKDTMTILKAKGHTFPELKEADAMFTADTAPDWADGKVCHRCRVEFSFTQRKHHCRNCGQIFCSQCSTKQCPLPKYGIEKDVRVCDGCYTSLQKPSSGKPRPAENDLPAEYLNSSLAQQVQTPPRKSEQELKEEEELQLALALSQSEAELKKKQPAVTTYRMLQRSPSPEAPPPTPGVVEDPDLAKYLNRSYWEQRKVNESPASPSAPSPMPQVMTTAPVISNKMLPDEIQIDEFANNMRSQVEIFVNRMKSNSSRGRSISNDSSVQTLFMTLTSLHSNQLSYIKEMDDKRMWYEQLQDKLAQIKDSRAALDVLRQEHIEKLRRIAEEQERQRQIQMAQKLEIMRKKKQEYLQYQRQLALQRIQEQEREMQMRQEQQKAQYRMGQTAFPFMPNPNPHASPNHQMNNIYNPYGFNPNSPGQVPPAYNPQGQVGPQPGQVIPPQGVPQPNMNAAPMPGMYTPGMPGVPLPNHPGMMVPGMPHSPMVGGNAVGQHMSPLPNPADGMTNMNAPNTPQQLPHSQMNPPMTHVMLQQQNVVQNQSPISTGMIQTTQAPPSMVHPMQQAPGTAPPIVGPVSMPNMNQQQPPVQTTTAHPVQQNVVGPAPIENSAVAEPPAAVQQQKVEEPPKEEVTTAELISFD